MQVLDKISIIQSAIDLASASICSKTDLATEQEDVEKFDAASAGFVFLA